MVTLIATFNIDDGITVEVTDMYCKLVVNGKELKLEDRTAHIPLPVTAIAQVHELCWKLREKQGRQV